MYTLYRGIISAKIHGCEQEYSSISMGKVIHSPLTIHEDSLIHSSFPERLEGIFLLGACGIYLPEDIGMSIK